MSENYEIHHNSTMRHSEVAAVDRAKDLEAVPLHCGQQPVELLPVPLMEDCQRILQDRRARLQGRQRPHELDQRASIEVGEALFLACGCEGAAHGAGHIEVK